MKWSTRVKNLSTGELVDEVQGHLQHIDGYLMSSIEEAVRETESVCEAAYELLDVLAERLTN